MKTLYISDLDGTLLDNQARLSEVTKEIINGLIAQGVAFTYATARSYTSASKVTAGLELQLPVVTYNGAFLVAPDGTVLEQHLLPAKATAALRKCIERTAVSPLVYALIDGKERVSWLRSRETAGVTNYLRARPNDPRLRSAGSVQELLAGEIFYASFIGEESELKAVGLFFVDRKDIYFNFQEDTYTDNEFWFEIYSSEASKAKGVLRLRERFAAERLVCFGDNVNDLPMFKFSDACYAVANARPALHKAATETIGSNEQDGVALWLQQHALRSS